MFDFRKLGSKDIDIVGLRNNYNLLKELSERSVSDLRQVKYIDALNTYIRLMPEEFKSDPITKVLMDECYKTLNIWLRSDYSVRYVDFSPVYNLNRVLNRYLKMGEHKSNKDEIKTYILSNNFVKIRSNNDQFKAYEYKGCMFKINLHSDYIEMCLKTTLTTNKGVTKELAEFITTCKSIINSSVFFNEYKQVFVIEINSKDLEDIKKITNELHTVEDYILPVNKQEELVV